ncbi:MAG: leucyl aminopeptidase [Lautropia sp.]|nr:MAG: leucyl aminopeptidase [Pseudomonadota bacterium]MBC6959444.1 leucyl aminopeptidase [Lautropia sp.]MCL4702767.1 leucyl aminopeptidase [Burkholderiaceae bacterium]MDL1908541.1 leucyl aminopeptidase [Betaproteobacteria bacterium PRO1]MEB2335939.1 leucyl aminopeptidase [Burkholderiales bacterium]
MQFSTRTTPPGRARADCALVPVLAGKELTAGGREIDAVHGGRLAKVIRSGDLPAKAGSTLLVQLDGHLPRALLVSMGEAREAAARAFTDAVRGALQAAGQLAADEALSLLHEAPVTGRDTEWKLRAQVLTGREIAYRFETLKTKRETRPVRPKRVVLPVSAGGAFRAAVAQATAIANGVDMARELGNLPANHCTPAYLADTARKMARELGLKAEVLDVRQMQALKMGALLSVARGSEQPPKLIVLRYQGAGAKQPPIALVGKGITFDTGGISLKPAAEMDEMKFDMCGAASVLGAMRAVAELKLKLNLVVVVPTTENMPGGRATKPGDIVASMSGQTVEILNTDAEGRLILCDALTYVQRFKPSTVIDVATLTGACVIALGHHRSGLFSPSDALATELLEAGNEIGDGCWRMPLDEEYQEQLKSPFADMANIGGRPAGSVTAACFLSRFAKGYDWAHLDIAGTAWKSGTNKGATGRPVPLLANFLLARARG